MLELRTFSVAGTDPAERAAALSAAGAGWLPATVAAYERLFAAAGLTPQDVHRLAQSARAALTEWAPDLASELDRYAEASGLPPQRIHALNARTELLAAAGAAGRGECSTVATVPPGGQPVGAQTWDWRSELADGWAVLEYPQAALPFVTLTEAGLLGKIGVNSAGLGLLFNILSHTSDSGTGGVPVHAVARRILDSADSVEAGVAILRSAPLSASSCFTLLDQNRVACLEASPAGVAELPPGRWTLHTNHFQDPELATGVLPIDPDSDSWPRLDVLASRTATSTAGGDAEGLVELLRAHAADGADLCCHAPSEAVPGEGWQTLATVALDPARRRISVLAGGPCSWPERQWYRFEAGR